MTQTLHEFIEKLQKIEEKYNAADWTLQQEILLLDDNDEYQYHSDYRDFSDFDLQIDDEHGYIIIPAEWDYEDEDDDDYDDDE
jgi:hypothetical protein